MTDRPAIIVMAYSARALASSANHAGFAPLSIDVFGDDDTRGMSLASVKLEGGLAEGLTLDKVAGAVETLLAPMIRSVWPMAPVSSISRKRSRR